MSGPVGRALEVLGPLAQLDVDLGPFCTYRVGGSASIYVEVRSLEDLQLVARAIEVSGLPTLLVGRGSNLLIADGGFAGIALRLGSEFADVVVPDSGSVLVRAGGAALLPVVARRTASAGLTGFEWAVGVPGSIGGAVRMNAGGHGSDMEASLVAVGLFDLGRDSPGGPGLREVPASELDLAYRSSSVAPDQVVVWADLALEFGDAERSTQELSDIVAWRRRHQPGGQNAGSVFANPPGDSAGRLIDSLGLKGLRIGSAEVSTKHANFIQTDPGGSADDVAALIREIQRRVLAATGHHLHTENRLVGFSDDDAENRLVGFSDDDAENRLVGFSDDDAENRLVGFSGEPDESG